MANSVTYRLPASGSAAVSPALQSYTHTVATVRRPLPTSDATVLASQAVTPDAVDHAVAGDSFHVQLVSDALPTGTRYAVGNAIKLVMQGLEPNAGCNQSIQLWVGVYSNDGATLRQTLRGKISSNELNTALRSLVISTTVATAYTTVSGDRLVIEVGVAGTPGSGSGTQGHNGTIRWGSNGAGGNLLENETQTGTTLNPWFQIQDSTTTAQAVAATAIGVATLAEKLTLHKLMAATAIAVAAMNPKLVYRRALGAVAAGVAAVASRLVLHQMLPATAGGVAGLSARLMLRLPMVATAVGLATLTTRMLFRRALAAIAVGIAGLSAIFHPGGDGPPIATGWISSIRRRRNRRSR